MVSKSPHLTEHIDGTLATLVEIGVTKKTADGEKCWYSLKPIDEGGPKDFLILRTQKKVHVSPEGNRAVRVESTVMAVRDKVTSRPCGSLIWSDEVAAPKFRLGPARRVDPLSEHDPQDPRFEILKKANNDMAFRLNFEPPLFSGEVVDYGFYVWTKKYYALSKKEALDRYHDEWTREGMAVNDPTFFLSIRVGMPAGFRYEHARVEKDPVLTQNGPNVPGSVVTGLKSNDRLLAFEIEKPSIGHYFLSWMPAN